MTEYLSRFRPRLDDPGACPDWQLSPEEQEAIAEVRAIGVATAVERLTNLYDDHEEVSGAIALINRLGAQSPLPRDLTTVARAIAAADYYHARFTVPQLNGGAAHGPAGPVLWQRLKPYLASRTLAMMRENMSEALLWRAVYSQIPDNWAPQAQMTRALQQELSASGLFDSVEVTLELNPPVAGGGRWVAMQTKGTLAELRDRLRRRQACLIELIRDPEADTPAVNLVVAYHLEDELTFGRDGVDRARLWVYDPRRGPLAVSLRLTLSDDRVQSVEAPAGDDLASVKAVRLVRLEAAQPPLFGWRRHFGSRLPWTAGWWANRLWQLHGAHDPGRSPT